MMKLSGEEQNQFSGNMIRRFKIWRDVAIGFHFDGWVFVFFLRR